MLAIEQQPRAIEPRWHISASRAVGLVMAVVAAVLLGLAGLGMDADTLHIHTQTPNTGAPTPAPAGGDYGAHAGFSIEVLHKPEGCAEILSGRPRKEGRANDLWQEAEGCVPQA